MYRFVYKQPRTYMQSDSDSAITALEYVLSEVYLENATSDDEALQEVEKILSEGAVEHQVWHDHMPVIKKRRPVTLMKVMVVKDWKPQEVSHG